MIEICNIASGSNGNCYYIGNDTDAVIIDAGIYFSRLEERMEIAGLNIKKIRACFISHEHHDHRGGMKIIAKKLMIPIYLTPKTYNAITKRNRPNNYIPLEHNSTTEINGINVWTFPKSHDATDPVSFCIEIDNHRIGVMTDLGIADETVQQNFSKCDACFLESNYDDDMLIHGTYPNYLKERVASIRGHLSNTQAYNLVSKYASPTLSHIILSHISEDNNTSDKIMETFAPLCNKYQISLASRHECGKVIRLE